MSHRRTTANSFQKKTTMSVTVGRAQLYDALKELRQKWAGTRELWKDSVAGHFEERYWNTVEGGTVSTIAAMDRLAQVLVQMQQDCGTGGDWLNDGR
jgi:hypothetical protein